MGTILSEPVASLHELIRHYPALTVPQLRQAISALAARANDMTPCRTGMHNVVEFLDEASDYCDTVKDTPYRFTPEEIGAQDAELFAEMCNDDRRAGL